MATHAPSGRVIPPCSGCHPSHDAEMVVAHPDGNAEPYCFPCGNTVMDRFGGIEYPIEEFYTHTDNRVSVYDVREDPAFEMFDPDHERAWLCADNKDVPGSSVYVDEYC